MTTELREKIKVRISMMSENLGDWELKQAYKFIAILYAKRKRREEK